MNNIEDIVIIQYLLNFNNRDLNIYIIYKKSRTLKTSQYYINQSFEKYKSDYFLL